MLRFKHFAGPSADLEKRVNEWLAQYEPDVTQMVQTVIADGTIIMGFLFEESFRGQELRMTSERGERRALAAPAASMPDRPLKVPIEPGALPEEPLSTS